MHTPPFPTDVTRQDADVIPLPRHQAPPPAIAVASGKGGVGRTHIAVNLACLWRAAGQRVLLVDGDIALGGADLLLGVAPANTVADLIAGRVSATDAIARSPSGVDLLAASAGQLDLAVLGDERRHLLLSAVDELEPNYDIVVIDTPGGLSVDGLGFCGAATEVIGVVTPEPASVEAICAWLEALASQTAVRRVNVVVNLVGSDPAGEEVFRRVVRRADHRPGVSTTIALNYLGALPIDPAVGRASLRGEPFCLADPGASASTALQRIAATLCEDAARTVDARSDGLFWRRRLKTTAQPPAETARLY